jgi:uncharacterized radical SAM superfamily Fe-S cluster-containing enzyme
VNDGCNLACPACFAASFTAKTAHRSLVNIERMIDALVASEGKPDLLQLSDGEPTIHPQNLEIIVAAERRPIRHLMINSNGIRIGQDPEFVKALTCFKPRIEIYLQFDSRHPEALKTLRGADLTRVPREALEAFEKNAISTTLVVVVRRGVDDDELGDVINHALQ